MVLVHLHVHGTCPCPCFMSMLNVQVSVHVHAVHHRCVCVCECVFVSVFVFVCINAGMPDCPASDQSGTGIKKTKKLTMPGQVRYRTKPRHSGIFLVRYRTEIIDAGVSFLDADAQLCLWVRCIIQYNVSSGLNNIV
jgi:hypothetical protein